MSDEWYYADENGRVGPLTFRELSDSLKTMSKEHVRKVLVWHRKFSDWQRAVDVPELATDNSKPPPLPSSFTGQKANESPHAARIPEGIASQSDEIAARIDEVPKKRNLKPPDANRYSEELNGFRYRVEPSGAVAAITPTGDEITFQSWKEFWKIAGDIGPIDNAGRGSTMQKIAGAIFVIIVVFYLIGGFGGEEKAPRPDIRDTSATDVVSTTAQELFRMYDNNEVATDNFLKGKIVEVKGMVQSINKDFLDNMYVSLVTPNQFMSANMHVHKSEETTLMSMRKGQIVVFRCAKMTRFVGSPSGDDCVVMSIN